MLVGDADADNLGSRFTDLTTGVIVNDGSTGNGIEISIGLGNVIDNSVNGLRSMRARLSTLLRYVERHRLRYPVR
ncbi:MAG: hypothetical protein R3F53_21610 [Gammaproteobacteria bacterium]